MFEMFEFFDFKNIKSYIPRYDNILIIFDENIYHYNKDIIDNLSYHKYQIESGESSKILKTKLEIEDFMFSNNFNKNSCLIALGGGVVGDLTGFIASTFMRGIDFYQIPTTLLAMVDSSIGGKTGIDNKWGKNLIGSFYLPKKILCDVSFLKTLEKEEFINGLAEVIKTAIVANPKLWKFLNDNDFDSIYTKSSNLKKMINMTSKTKLGIVNQDFKEKLNQRHILNFGHTVGHAIEALTLEKHGYCVAIGIATEIKFKENNKFVVPFYLQKQIINCLIKYKLPTTLDLDLNHQDILNKINLDKKNGILVLINQIGDPVLKIFNHTQILETLSLKRLIKLRSSNHNNYDINCPSSKSETNRVLILAALGKGEIKIKNILMSDDTIYMIQALQTLGVQINILDSSTIIVNGTNGELNFNDGIEIFLGNSGTSVRFLTAILGLLNNDKKIILTGDSYMKKRPIQDLIDSLSNLGVDINSINNDGCPPLIIKGKNTYINSNTIKISTVKSSQYLTGILLASASVKNNNIIIPEGEIVSQKFIDLTFQIMKDFGINISFEKGVFLVENQSYMNPTEYTIQADSSSASYILGISAILNKNILINNLNNMNKQGDTFINQMALKKLGFNLIVNNDNAFIDFNNKINCDSERIIDCDSSDTFLTWVILACFIPGKTKIINIKNQNIKECKRVDVIFDHLKKANVDISRNDTDLEIIGKDCKNYNGIEVNCHNDHRIAMSFSLFGLLVPNVIISDYSCVEKTFPSFWELTYDLGLENHYYKNILEQKKDEYNPIILIGMTKAGKSTLGRNFAKKSKLSYTDTDLEIERKYGCSPEKIIIEKGWDYFRDIESDIFKAILSSKKYMIISTGGGIVERESNLNLLKDYNYVIHVIRNVSAIQEMIDLNIWKDKFDIVWKKRENIYKKYSTYQFFNDDNPDKFCKWLNKIINPVIINKKNSFFLCLDGSNLENKESIIKNIDADAIELRGDLLDKYDFDYIDQQINFLIKWSNLPIIFTFRSVDEGGKYSGDQVEKYLERAIYNGVSLIDVELKTNKKIEKKHSLVIGSCHSESWNKLETTVRKGFYFHKPDIIKLVGNENFKSLMFDLVKDYSVNKIILTSGNEGKMSRVYNEFLTPITNKHMNSVALGQLTKEEIIQIRKILNLDETKKLYLIGSKISESPSPFIHNYVFNHYNLWNDYKLFDTSDIKNVENIIKDNNFKGASVTIPFKESISDYLDELTIDSQEIKAVNTIYKIDNKLIGANTDWRALFNIIDSLKNLNLGCVIGTGGAARAACYAFKKSNIKFDVLGRNKINGLKLIQEFNGRKYSQLDYLNNDHQVIIICVPNNVDIPFKNLSPNSIIIDMSYSMKNPRNYPKNMKIYDGYTILKDQAIEQFKYWEGKKNNLNNIYSEGMGLFIGGNYSS